jgi:hypothetical protein
MLGYYDIPINLLSENLSIKKADEQMEEFKVIEIE